MNKSVIGNAPAYRAEYIESDIGGIKYRVNIYNGRIDFFKNIFSASGELLPMSLSLAYNPFYSGSNLSSAWKLNLKQIVYAQNDLYYYIDAEFRVHEFKRLAGNTYYDTEHTGLILNVSGSGYEITDQRLTTFGFNGNGNLIKITVNNGSKPSVVSISDNFTSITDGMGRNALISDTAEGVIITLPNGKRVNYCDNGITDISGNKYTFTFSVVNGYSLLTGISSTFGAGGSIFYDGKMRVSRIDEKINGKTIKSYYFSYESYFTDVETRRFSSGISNAITMRYVFSDDGILTTSYEDTDNGYAAIRFESEEKYRDYALTFKGQENYTAKESEYTVNGSNDANIKFNGYPTLNAGEGYLLCAEVERVITGTNGNDPLSLIAFLNISSPTEINTGVCGTGLSLRNYGGKQVVLGSLTPTSPIRLNNILVVTGETGVNFKLSNVRVAKEVNDEVGSFANIVTGGSSVTEGGTGAVWYELKNVRINGGASVKMSADDWAATLYNYNKNKTDYIVWANDKSVAYKNAAVKFDGQANNVNLSTVKIAEIATKGQRKIFGYASYSSSGAMTVTENTVFSSGTSKICTLKYDEYGRLHSAQNSAGLITEYVYDDYGNLVRQKMSADGKYIVYDNVYGDATGENFTSGKYLRKEIGYCKLFANTNQIGNSYGYDNATGNVTESTHTGEAQINYGYYADGNLSTVSATVASAENKNEFTYENDLLKTAKHNDYAYTFGYDDYQNLIKTTAGGTSIVTWNYDYVYLTCETVVSSGKIWHWYNKYGAELQTTLYASGSKTYMNLMKTYETPTASREAISKSSSSATNLNCILRKKFDNGNSVSYSTYYDYDALLQLSKITKYDTTDGNKKLYEISIMYESEYRLSSVTVDMFGAKATRRTVYENGDTLTEDYVKQTAFEFSDDQMLVQSDYKKDKLGRAESYKVGEAYINLPTVMASSVTDTYAYAEGITENGVTSTTNFVSGVTRAINQLGTVKTESESYMYDGGGNMGWYGRSVNGNNVLTLYSYDKAGRLTREDNAYLQRAYAYEYDGGGNILRKKEYEITNIGSSGTLLKTYEYGYSSTHKDRLISFNGQSISYNSSGCPTSYKGKTLTWYATVLKKYGTTEYEYTADKLRYKKKTSDGTEHTYYYEGTRLIGEKVVKTDGTEYTLEYFYDERGIMGVRHNKTPYIFVKNIQGDIVAIYDLYGKVAEYVYDAWGNCTVAYSGNDIAEINPIRYRGYYYDTDSKLYYLITRYYDPETGRFISPDGIEYLAPEQLNGLNLYAYCNNNPVMNVDPSGTLFFTILLISIAIGAAVGATVNGVNAYRDGARGWDLVGEIATGAVIGGGIGALAGIVAGGGAALIGAGASLIGSGLGAAAIAGGGTIGLGSVLLGTGYVVVGGALVSTGVIGGVLGLNVWFSNNASRYGSSKIGSNGYYNKQFDDFWNQYGDGDLNTRRRFHDYITKKGYNKWKQLLKAWQDFLGR